MSRCRTIRSNRTVKISRKKLMEFEIEIRELVFFVCERVGAWLHAIERACWYGFLYWLAIWVFIAGGNY